MKRMNSKAVALLITIAVLLTVTVGGTVAYLAASTPSVTNVFTPGSVVPEINEELNGNVKQNVTVKNIGNVDAYIRAKIVVTWKKGNEVYPVMPVADTDYTISLNTGSEAGKWTYDAAADIYYYNGKVGAGLSTANLINSCQQAATANVPDGYTLHVEILAQAIQADGWPAEVDTAQEAFEAAKNTNG